MNQTMTAQTMVFRKTNAHIGRHISVTPANSTNRLLSYGRIILNNAGLKDAERAVSFTTGGSETSLIVLSGAARISTDGKDYELSQFDGIYIPRDSSVRISTSQSADIAEFSA